MRVILGGIVSEARGKLGGIVASRNRGGAYLRGMVVPTDPGTTHQTTVRGYMADLSNRWVNTLTYVQRAAWDAYAAAVLLPGSTGVLRNVGGLGMYCRTNVPALQAGLTRVDDAPTIFDTGDFTLPSIASITASTNVLSLAFEDEDDWAAEDDAVMLVYGSRPMNPTRNFFKGPYRFLGTVVGNSVAPPTTPQAFDLAFPVEVGHRVFIQVRVLRADGRLSSNFRDVGTAV